MSRKRRPAAPSPPPEETAASELAEAREASRRPPAQAPEAREASEDPGDPAARSLALRVVSLGALGYFIDILDLFLFSVLRVPSLKGLGVPAAEHLARGVLLLNSQLAGLLIGSFVWGILGDRRGRVRALYGSLLLYSLATLANGFVQDVPTYAACRFLSGLGLAGELGAAITLVSETLPRERRGVGTTLVAGFGLCGGIAAAALAELLPWRTCYFIGGSLGLVLLALRVRLLEPRLFLETAATRVPRGSLRLLFGDARRRGLYFRLVLVGLPIWFVSGILMVFSPELARALAIPGITAARAVLASYIGAALGDFASGLLSQHLKSRKRAIGLFLLGILITVALYLKARGVPPTVFYAICFIVGLGTGYWAVLITTAAEHFGTNLRALVTTSVPNLIRAGAIPLTLLFQTLTPTQGPITTALYLGLTTLLAAAWALRDLQETYTKDLNYQET